MTADERVGDMNRHQLRALVEEIVGERLRWRSHYRQHTDRPLAEVLEEMQQLIIVPPPGSPSVVELLREDRDR